MNKPHELGFTYAGDMASGSVVSPDVIARSDPDYLFVIDRTSITGNGEESADKESADSVRPVQDVIDNSETLKNSRAVLEGRVFYLDPADWYLVGGGLTTMNYMVDAVDQMSKR